MNRRRRSSSGMTCGCVTHMMGRTGNEEGDGALTTRHYPVTIRVLEVLMPRPRDSLATSIAAARTKAHLSQRELAKRAKLDPSYVSMIESGTRRPSYAVLVKLADAMGTTLTAIVGKVDADRLERGGNLRSASA